MSQSKSQQISNDLNIHSMFLTIDKLEFNRKKLTKKLHMLGNSNKITLLNYPWLKEEIK